MKTAKQLRDERAAKVEQMQGLLNVAKAENRELSAEESAEWDKLEGEVDTLQREVERTERMERISGEKVIRSSSKQEAQKIKEQYSFLRMVRGMVSGKLDGLEQEMHEEAQKEARESGVEVKGFGIPLMVLEGRAQSVLGGTQPDDGGQLVKDEAMQWIDMLKDALVTRQLGANYITGLKGTVPFDKITQGALSTWKGEIAELDESTLKFSGAEMKPNRLGTFTVISKQLMIQSTPSIEALVRRELAESIAYAVDKAAINGSGTAPEPRGVLNTSGIGSVPIATNGGAPTYNHIVGLENAIEVANASMGNLRYLINAKTKAKLKLTKLDEGSGLFLMPGNNELNGYGVVTSNMVPSNLTKGDGTALSAIVYGNWSDLLIGQWGGLDLMADPYTLATSGRVRLIVDSFWDVFVRRAVSFAAIKDAVTTL
jgi:HK97 family phage major capsid protein